MPASRIAELRRRDRPLGLLCAATTNAHDQGRLAKRDHPLPVVHRISFTSPPRLRESEKVPTVRTRFASPWDQQPKPSKPRLFSLDVGRPARQPDPSLSRQPAHRPSPAEPGSGGLVRHAIHPPPRPSRSSSIGTGASSAGANTACSAAHSTRRDEKAPPAARRPARLSPAKCARQIAMNVRVPGTKETTGPRRSSPHNSGRLRCSRPAATSPLAGSEHGNCRH